MTRIEDPLSLLRGTNVTPPSKNFGKSLKIPVLIPPEVTAAHVSSITKIDDL
jgi:hypothetical protein